MLSTLWFSVALAQSGWDDTLHTVANAVVAIKMDIPRAFDGKGRSNSQATGFVIDAERGLILTNRHVVTPGPVKAKAIFFDKEEVALTPVYRDPVHDFGVYRYDPAELEHMAPPSLPLSPERARVGLNIRVVGNDGGDQLQILDGTLARLDREAPHYGAAFNDFNTFYLQAASATSGGSSGSPVVDIDGYVVGLNAGSMGSTASSYYLPLDRVVRAVDLLAAGEAVPRGTLQTTVVHATFDELARMQVSEEVLSAARLRRPEGTGLLVVRTVLPGGPAAGKLEIGDVVLYVGEEAVHDHVTLEGALDSAVGRALTLTVARGPEVVEVDLTVGDLHAITPDRFLEMGRGVVHPLSYHQARVMQTAVAGISVAERGYVLERAGVPPYAVIVEVDGQPTTTLEALDEQLAAMGQGQPFRIRYFERGKPQETFVRTARMDRAWFDQRLCVRDDSAGAWPCTASAVNEAAWQPEAVKVSLPPVEDKLAAKLQPSLVRLEVRIPYQIAGLPGDSFSGVGLLVGPGLVLTDRDTLPEALADIHVVIGGVLRLPAQVVALHPVHNLAVLRFDPTPVEGVELAPVTWREDFHEGEELFYVGLTGRERLVVRDTGVQAVVPLHLSDDGSPRFREVGLDVMSVHPELPGVPGVLVDKKGRVGGLWASFSYTTGRDTHASWYGVGRAAIDQTLALADGETGGRSLPWELAAVSFPTALEAGVPPAEVEALVAVDPEHRAALMVKRVMAGSSLAQVVRPGDILLSINGRSVTRFAAVEAEIQGVNRADLRVWRDGQAVEVTLTPEPLDPIGVDRVVLWSGLRIHAAHRSARMQGMADCPYVSFRSGGSPGSRAGIYAWRCIVGLNGTPTPTLDALLQADAALEDGASVRVELITLEGRREVRTLELERNFWPTRELVWEGEGWTRR